MFDYDIQDRKHHTAKEGNEVFTEWLVKMRLDPNAFPFKVKTGRFTRKGYEVFMNVVSWGFYQGSDYRYYVFITYRSSDNVQTCAYHWDVDDSGLPTGTPRKHWWDN